MRQSDHSTVLAWQLDTFWRRCVADAAHRWVSSDDPVGVVDHDVLEAVAQVLLDLFPDLVALVEVGGDSLLLEQGVALFVAVPSEVDRQCPDRRARQERRVNLRISETVVAPGGDIVEAKGDLLDVLVVGDDVEGDVEEL